MSKSADEKTSTTETTAPARPAVNRRSPLDYFNPIGAGNRLRQKVIEGSKTFAWVVVLTMIIWIYAERMQVVQTTGPNVTNVPVQIFSSNPNLSVQMVDSQPVINLRLTGPQNSIEIVKEKLQARNIPPHDIINIDIGSRMGTGENQPVNILNEVEQIMRDDSRFKGLGISVQDCQPQTINVNIDRRIHKSLDVQVRPGMENVAPETRFEPKQVTVSGPKNLLEKLIKDNNLSVYADLANYDLKEGEHTLQGVSVTLSVPQDRLTIDPMQVNATVVIHAANEPFLIKSMPVVVDAEPQTLKKFDVDLSGFEIIRDTNVTGPHDKIQLLINNQFKPKAILEISLDDFADPKPKRLRYVLPEGVTVTDADAARTVTFTMTQRPQ